MFRDRRQAQAFVELHDQLTMSATGTAHLLVPRMKRNPRGIVAAEADSAEPPPPQQHAPPTGTSIDAGDAKGHEAVGGAIGGSAQHSPAGAVAGQQLPSVAAAPTQDHHVSLVAGVSAVGSAVLRTSARRLSLVMADARNASASAAAVVTSHIAELLDFNLLETALLSSSTAVLISGMIFQSAAMPIGSPAYIGLTVFVACVFTASVGLFVWMLVVETRRSCQQKRLAKDISKLQGGTMAINPMTRLRSASRALASRAMESMSAVLASATSGGDPPPGSPQSARPHAMLQKFKSTRWSREDRRTSMPRRGGASLNASGGAAQHGASAAAGEAAAGPDTTEIKQATVTGGPRLGGASAAAWVGGVVRRKTFSAKSTGAGSREGMPLPVVEPMAAGAESVTAAAIAMPPTASFTPIGSWGARMFTQNQQRGARAPALSLTAKASEPSAAAATSADTVASGLAPDDDAFVIFAPAAPADAQRARSVSMMERVRRLKHTAAAAPAAPPTVARASHV